MFMSRIHARTRALLVAASRLLCALAGITVTLLLMALPATAQSYPFDIVWTEPGGGTAAGRIVVNRLDAFCVNTPNCLAINSFTARIEGKTYSKADMELFTFDVMDPLYLYTTNNQFPYPLTAFGFTGPGEISRIAPRSIGHVASGRQYQLTSFRVGGPSLGLSLSQPSVALTRGVAMSPVTATAGGGADSYSFTIAPALPAGLSIDPSTGTISGTPTVSAASTSYTVMVSDAAGSTETEALTLLVDHPPLELSLSHVAVPLTRGVAMTPVTATATGGDEHYSFTIAPTLPAGLSINASTGAISGTATVSAAAANYTVTVTDGAGITETATLALAVSDPALGLSLSQSSIALTRDVEMAPVTATATGGDEQYSFTITPALPAGLSIDASTGAISGTPTVSAAAANYTVTVTDGAGATETATLALTVSDPALGLGLSQSSIALMRGVEMAPVTATATGGDEHYGFTIAPALPAGLSIDANTGAISGTPTVSAAAANYTVTLTDGAGITETARLAITVQAPGNQAPTADAGPDQTVVSAASVTLDGSASSDPDAEQSLSYTWTQTEGPQVTLIRAATAQPGFTAPTLAAGDSDLTLIFSLVVTDSMGLASDADTVSITVQAPGNQAPTADAGQDQTVVSAASVSSDGSASSDPDTDSNGNRLTTGGNSVMATTDLGILRQNPEGTTIPMRDIGDGSYVAWLRSEKAGVATVSVTVDGTPAGAIRVTFAPQAVNIVDETEAAIAGFMLNRANRLISAQPDLTRFLRGETCGHFNASGNDLGGMVNGCVMQGNSWAELTASWGAGSRYALSTFGAHQHLGTDLLVGGMLQLESFGVRDADASGTGWMAGPYFVARLEEHPLHIEGRLLYGRTDNSIAPLSFYTDRFTTSRWLAQIGVEGEIEQAPMTWIPRLRFAHTREDARGYTDRLGNVIASQSIAVTQVSSGLDFRLPLAVKRGQLDLTGGASLIYSATRGGAADFEGGRGRLHLGMSRASGTGADLRASAFYDGIASGHISYGALLGLDLSF